MNLKQKLSWAVLILVLAACKPAYKENNIVQAAEPEATASTCQLTMGMDAWEPYQYIAVGNKVAGLDVELAQAAADVMQCELNVVQGSWLELLTMLKAGDVDFVLGASKTPDRESFAYFSEPYRQERFLLYVRKDDSVQSYDSIKEFIKAGNKLGIVNEYYYGEDIAALYADQQYRPQFVGAFISELNMARLLDEEIDGLLEDSFVGASILRRKGLDKYIEPHGISLGSSDVFVMFSKKSVSEDQVAAFNQALQQLHSSGEYQRLIDKYSL